MPNNPVLNIVHRLQPLHGLAISAISRGPCNEYAPLFSNPLRGAPGLAATMFAGAEDGQADQGKLYDAASSSRRHSLWIVCDQLQMVAYSVGWPIL